MSWSLALGRLSVLLCTLLCGIRLYIYIIYFIQKYFLFRMLLGKHICDMGVKSRAYSNCSHYQVASSVVAQMSASNWNRLGELAKEQTGYDRNARRQDEAAVISH